MKLMFCDHCQTVSVFEPAVPIEGCAQCGATLTPMLPTR